MSYDTSKFTAVLPARARAFAPAIVMASDDIVTPFLIYGVGDRETNWGTNPSYRKDTGDWSPRLWSHDHIGRFPHVNVVGQKNGLFLVMPADGLGWGRGVMQLDYVAEYDWLQTHDWRDPAVSVPRGVDHLRTKFTFFNSTAPVIGLTDGKIVTVTPAFATEYSDEHVTIVPGTYPDTRPFVGGALETAAVAAYNADFGHVLAAIIGGGIAAADAVTTEKNYSSDVRGRAAALQIRYDTA